MYGSAGIMNTVSTSGLRRRFISAICISYSKSDTARRPRTMTLGVAPPSVVHEQAVEGVHFDIGAVAEHLARDLDALGTVKSGDFSALIRTATTMRSKSREPRWMMSTCPLVSGSKEPG